MPCTNRLIDRNQDQNSTLYCVFKYENEDGTAIDMTGATSVLTIKEDASDPDSEAVVDHEVSGDASGIFDLSVSLSGIAIGTYRYDIVTIDSGGTREVVENKSIVINETVGD